MKNLKVIGVSPDAILFTENVSIQSSHQSSCCEYHWLSFGDVTLSDFEGLEFDLSGDDFFDRIEDYGIGLKPINGFPVRIPGYGSNNGYYGSNIDLEVLVDNKVIKSYDVSECQEWSDQ